MVQLRWFLLREIGFSVHTTAMANCEGPTAMVFVKGNWLFCSYNCDALTEDKGFLVLKKKGRK
uniref:Uncharacterized protein n=1 Tax=Picea glauca TaxID=3330 RepID=A0A101M592_PICGL|nr:hypothetical protein ABT39_MTgene4652 [Picea glauca]KUM51349.1 hypothetical protein ABT39_MTgene1196 [Picea glauca]